MEKFGISITIYSIIYPAIPWLKTLDSPGLEIFVVGLSHGLNQSCFLHASYLQKLMLKSV
jgi:hypothetical protein